MLFNLPAADLRPHPDRNHSLLSGSQNSDRDRDGVIAARTSAVAEVAAGKPRVIATDDDSSGGGGPDVSFNYEGYRVEANQQGSGAWRGGHLARMHHVDSYDIEYDDGTVEREVPSRGIRIIGPAGSGADKAVRKAEANYEYHIRRAASQDVDGEQKGYSYRIGGGGGGGGGSGGSGGGGIPIAFQLGNRVQQKKGGRWVDGHIVAVRASEEDPAVPCYDVRLADGTDKVSWFLPAHYLRLPPEEMTSLESAVKSTAAINGQPQFRAQPKPRPRSPSQPQRQPQPQPHAPSNSRPSSRHAGPSGRHRHLVGQLQPKLQSQAQSQVKQGPQGSESEPPKSIARADIPLTHVAAVRFSSSAGKAAGGAVGAAGAAAALGGVTDGSNAPRRPLQRRPTPHIKRNAQLGDAQSNSGDDSDDDIDRMTAAVNTRANSAAKSIKTGPRNQGVVGAGRAAHMAATLHSPTLLTPSRAEIDDMTLEAIYRGSGVWAPVLLLREHQNQTVDVQFMNGEVETCLPYSSIRPRHSLRPHLQAPSSKAPLLRGSSTSSVSGGREPTGPVGKSSRAGNKNLSRQQGHEQQLYNHPLEVGAAVEANFRGAGLWAPGTIKRDRGDGSYDVKYQDGEFETRVPAALIRRQGLSIAGNAMDKNPSRRQGHEQQLYNHPLEVGAAVEANFRGAGLWAPGTIKRDRGDGSYDVKYQDGEFETRVPAALIRRQGLSIATDDDDDDDDDGHARSKKGGSRPDSRSLHKPSNKKSGDSSKGPMGPKRGPKGVSKGVSRDLGRGVVGGPMATTLGEGDLTAIRELLHEKDEQIRALQLEVQMRQDISSSSADFHTVATETPAAAAAIDVPAKVRINAAAHSSGKRVNVSLSGGDRGGGATARSQARSGGGSGSGSGQDAQVAALSGEVAKLYESNALLSENIHELNRNFALVMQEVRNVNPSMLLAVSNGPQRR